MCHCFSCFQKPISNKMKYSLEQAVDMIMNDKTESFIDDEEPGSQPESTFAECVSTVPQVLQEAEDQSTSTGSHSAAFDTSAVGDDLLLVNQSTLEEVISNTC